MSALAVRPAPRPLTVGRVTLLGAVLLLHGTLVVHAVRPQDGPSRPQPATAPAGSSNTTPSVGAATTTAAATTAAAGELPRRGTLGLGVERTADGDLAVSVVRPDSPAARAGLQPGDLIRAVGDREPQSVDEFLAAARVAPVARPLALRVQRGGEALSLEITPDPIGTEPAPPGSTLRYGAVTVPAGYRLRTIITEPAAATGPAPALFFVQGLYCATLDRPQALESVDTRLVHALAAAGFVTLRVDKPGLGDSEGPPCGDIDFQTELAGYTAALRELVRLPSVDPARIYVFGHSMGGVMAPYLAQAVPVRGTIVYGTLARTWFEYCLENTRRQATLGGAGPGDVNALLLTQVRLLSPLLVDKQMLGDIWARHPELREDDPMLEPTRMYGRHLSFFHQLQDLNLAAAWEQADTHVLAIHGEYDWVTAQEDHDLIAAIAGARGRVGTALTLPSMDHGFTTHPTLAASLAAMGRGTWDGALPKAVLDWIATLPPPDGATSAPAAAPARDAAGTTQPATTSATTQPVAPDTVASGGPASAPAGPPDAFPAAWLGRWKGEVEVLGGTTASPGFTMELRIARTDRPDVYMWTIIYDGEMGRQERPYLLRVKDAARGEYVIDEANGILLPTRLIGDTLFSSFVVQGARVSVREQLRDAGTPQERIEVDLLTLDEGTPVRSGGAGDIPEVRGWSPRSLQRAVLRRK